MNARIYLIIILGITIMLNAMEQTTLAPSAESMVTLVSSDGQEFKVPLEIAQQSPQIKASTDFKIERIELDIISGQELAEIAQLMQMLYQHKNLNEKQFLKKAEQEIPIKDNFAFLIAVQYLSFIPGIDFIAEKYKQKDDYFFPKNEYDYWMKLIQEINPAAYEKLKKCEAANAKPCLEMAAYPESSGLGESDKIHGYPTLIFEPRLKYLNQEIQKESLSWFLNEYASVHEITESERKQILEIIKFLAPTLYEAIIAVDPTGIDHIKRDYTGGKHNASITYSKKDGLPVISVGAEVEKFSKNDAYAIIAHELGHYVLGHIGTAPILTHKALEKVMTEKLIKGKRVSGQLPFKESFELAFMRQKEYEADRFAVIELGIPIDDAIALEKRLFLESEHHEQGVPEKETFKSTHPLWTARIKQFEDLHREVELHQAQKRQPKQINWKELAQNYLKGGKS